MKLYFNIISTIALLVIFHSCTEEEDMDIVISRDSYEIPASGGQIEVPVKSNVPIEIKTTAPWISRSDGRDLSGTRILYFTIEPNKSAKERRADIILQSSDHHITVTQHGILPYGNLTIHYKTDRISMVPVFNETACGFVQWDQKNFEAYHPSLFYEYGQGHSHTVRFEMEQAESFHLKNIVGVESIDLREF